MHTGSSANSNPQHMAHTLCAHTLCKLAAAHDAVPTVAVTAADTRELAGTWDIIIGISCRRTAVVLHDGIAMPSCRNAVEDRCGPIAVEGPNFFSKNKFPGGGHGKPFYVCLRMEDRRATVTDALQSTTFRLYSSAAVPTFYLYREHILSIQKTNYIIEHILSI